MKRSLVAFGIVFLLMVSIVSAGVLNYYGKVTGTATVSGPTFYASSEGSFPLYKLLINALPTTYQEISFIDGSSIWFKTDHLGINSFYPATYNFYVKAKAESANYKMYLEYAIVRADGTSTTICSRDITIDSTDYKIYQTSCSGAGLTLASDDSFGWKISGAVASVNYYVMPDGSTKVEVSKA